VTAATGTASGLRKRFGPAAMMGGGLLVVGIAGYGFIALTGRTLSTADAAAVSSLYLMINIIGPGVFVALEQETSRSVSSTLARGGDPGPVARRAATLAGSLLVGVLIVLAAVSPVLVHRALGGHWPLLVAVLLGTVTSALVYLARGLLGGTRRFAGYSATLAFEGAARLLPCVAVAASGVPDAGLYALLFASGSAIGALAGTPWLRDLRRGATRPADGTAGIDDELAGVDPTAVPDSGSLSGMATATLVLAGSTLLSQLVANLAPIVVSSRLTTDTATAAAFTSAFILVRIPFFLFAPVQAMLLPTLTAAATTGRLAVFRRTLRLILTAIAVVGVPGAIASLLVGPWLVQVLFGAHVRLSGVVLGLLGVGTIGLMVAQALQPALVALGRHRSVTMSWLAGSVVLTGLLFLPGDPVHAAVIAQLAGSVLVVGGMVLAVRAELRGRSAATPEPVPSPGG
jgi:O-antigen/teichoic acid export membrane protein